MTVREVKRNKNERNEIRKDERDKNKGNSEKTVN